MSKDKVVSVMEPEQRASAENEQEESVEYPSLRRLFEKEGTRAAPLSVLVTYKRL